MVVPSSLLYCFEEMQFGEVVLLLGFVLLLCESQLLELGMHLQELLLGHAGLIAQDVGLESAVLRVIDGRQVGCGLAGLNALIMRFAGLHALLMRFAGLHSLLMRFAGLHALLMRFGSAVEPCFGFWVVHGNKLMNGSS